MKEYLGNIDEYLEYRQKESIREVSIEKSKLAEAKQEVPAPKVKEEPKLLNRKRVRKQRKRIFRIRSLKPSRKSMSLKAR